MSLYPKISDHLLEGSLGLLGQSGESGGIADGDLGEHLAVEIDAGLLQTVDERGIVHAVELRGSGDSGDPQAAEVTLLLLAADLSVLAALHDSLLAGL